MTLKIVGAGFGRTGTYSLKAGLEQLGFGPCHHMSNVINDPDQIARWSKAASGKPDLNRIFQGFSSAVDFPVAAFWQEAMADWPDARVILSYRDAEDWYESFSQTILPLVLDKASWPQKSRPWFEMLPPTAGVRSAVFSVPTCPQRPTRKPMPGQISLPR